MTTFIKKSGILPWQSERINEAPTMPGVYVFRTSTEINSIVYVGSADNLQRKLNEQFLSGDIPEIMFFDWYETSSIEDARTTEKEWVSKYSPKYNQGS